MRLFFFFQAEDGIRDYKVTGVQTCALPILHETEGDERPRQREVPVERAREPAAEPAPVRELGAVEWDHEVRPAAVSEPGVGFVDLETARDHAGEYDHGRPMGEADDPVVAAHQRPRVLLLGHDWLCHPSTLRTNEPSRKGR